MREEQYFHYNVTSKLGMGSFGEVSKVSRLTDGKEFALKMLKRDMIMKSPRLMQMINHEVTGMLGHFHPHIVTLYDAFTIRGDNFLIYELCEPQSLKTRLKNNGNWPEQEIVTLAKQMLLALKALHKLEIIHRDIKPDNILVKGGRFKLADFGLCHKGGSHYDNDLIGSPAYLAPEVFKRRYYSPKSDLYALGISLYELYNGKYPFDQRNENALARKKAEFIPTKNHLPNASDDLITMFRMMIHPVYDERATVEEMMEALGVDGSSLDAEIRAFRNEFTGEESPAERVSGRTGAPNSPQLNPYQSHGYASQHSKTQPAFHSQQDFEQQAKATNPYNYPTPQQNWQRGVVEDQAGGLPYLPQSRTPISSPVPPRPQAYKPLNPYDSPAIHPTSNFHPYSPQVTPMRNSRYDSMHGLVSPVVDHHRRPHNILDNYFAYEAPKGPQPGALRNSDHRPGNKEKDSIENSKEPKWSSAQNHQFIPSEIPKMGQKSSNHRAAATPQQTGAAMHGHVDRTKPIKARKEIFKDDDDFFKTGSQENHYYNHLHTETSTKDKSQDTDSNGGRNSYDRNKSAQPGPRKYVSSNRIPNDSKQATPQIDSFRTPQPLIPRKDFANFDPKSAPQFQKPFSGYLGRDQAKASVAESPSNVYGLAKNTAAHNSAALSEQGKSRSKNILPSYYPAHNIHLAPATENLENEVNHILGEITTLTDHYQPQRKAKKGQYYL